MKLYNEKRKSLFSVNLNQVIDQGGEGVILPHPKDKQKVVKIYHNHIQPSLTLASAQLLQSLSETFVKPEQLLYDKKGSLQGFSMAKLSKDMNIFSTLFSKNMCAQLQVDESFKLQLATSLTTAVSEAHKLGIVLGDLNAFNLFFNQKSALKIIDVDSFQTPFQTHSGRMMEEIVDFYYTNDISESSDYYAVATHVFRMLTYVHPFKGVHKTYKSLRERAAKQISVLSNDCDLKLPKFYQPIQNKYLLDQFWKIFQEGDRFLLQLNQPVAVQNPLPMPSVKPASVQTFTKANFRVQLLSSQAVYCHFESNLGLIKDASQTKVLQGVAKGNCRVEETLPNTNYDEVLLGSKEYFIRRNEKLYLNKTAIANFEIPSDFQYKNFENHVIGVDDENLYKIDLNKRVGTNINWKKVPTWGQGFKFHGMPVQLTGGQVHLHYLDGETFNEIKLPFYPLAMRMKEKLALVSYLKNDSLIHQWLYISDLQLTRLHEEDALYSFVVKKIGNQEIAFVAKEGCIEVYRIPDFTLVEKLELDFVSSQSELFLNKAGIVVWEGNKVYLVNKM